MPYFFWSSCSCFHLITISYNTFRWDLCFTLTILVNFGDYFVAEDSRSLLLLIFMCSSWKKVQRSYAHRSFSVNGFRRSWSVSTTNLDQRQRNFACVVPWPVRGSLLKLAYHWPKLRSSTSLDVTRVYMSDEVKISSSPLDLRCFSFRATVHLVMWSFGPVGRLPVTVTA